MVRYVSTSKKKDKFLNLYQSTNITYVSLYCFISQSNENYVNKTSLIPYKNAQKCINRKTRSFQKSRETVRNCAFSKLIPQFSL